MNREVVLTRLREAASAAAHMAGQARPESPAGRAREQVRLRSGRQPGAAHFTAFVPYHGLVDWAATDIDRYADWLHSRHCPDRVRVLGRPPTCKTCRVLWPCAPFKWAERWLSNVTHTEPEQRS